MAGPWHRTKSHIFSFGARRQCQELLKSACAVDRSSRRLGRISILGLFPDYDGYSHFKCKVASLVKGLFFTPTIGPINTDLFQEQDSGGLLRLIILLLTLNSVSQNFRSC